MTRLTVSATLLWPGRSPSRGLATEYSRTSGAGPGRRPRRHDADGLAFQHREGGGAEIENDVADFGRRTAAVRA